MKVGVGFSDNPESDAAGIQAAAMAVLQAGRKDTCDIALMFSTARHDQVALRRAVASVIGDSAPIYGGGAAGIITNENYGYAGDQIAVACIWLDGVGCDALVESGLNEGEEETGIRLGRRLVELGTKPDSPVMMFYDSFDCTEGVRMLMATWLLNGIEKGLGFFPDLTGAGLMGSHAPGPTKQWTGDGIGEHSVIALAFSGDIRIDSVIMHGCRPATGYYTVTKAIGQVILEINGKPAIQFIDELLDSAITPDQYPFFLIFGVNHGQRWGEYDEDYYASRLCLGIDKDSGGIVMFEADMVEGTEFQIMIRSLELDYMKPKVDRIFEAIDDREPVFAVYIDCAGRCAGYAGSDLEDALVIQSAVAGRVPILGMYTGVEIASIGGRPRGLDWTGVFCLFSQSRDGSGDAGKTKINKPVWDYKATSSGPKDAPAQALSRLIEQGTARLLSADMSSIAIRHELEHKRRGFSLLSELSMSHRQGTGYENVFIPATKRINAALDMQRTAVLMPDGTGLFTTEVLQGYTAKEKARLAGRRISIPEEMLDPNHPVIVTGEDSAERFREIREILDIPYFISSPVMLQGEVYAILLTGRLLETGPYLVRLSRSDMETVQALGALLASLIGRQRLKVSEERNRIMVDTLPVCCTFWDEKGNLTDCNKENLSMFKLSNKEEFIREFNNLSPEYQPDGRHSRTTAKEYIFKAFISGEAKFKWIHKMPDGELFPVEITAIRVPKGEDYIVVAYIQDLRVQEAAQAKMNEALELIERHIQAKNEFLASVSHEIRTPMNAIAAMARMVGEIPGLPKDMRSIINQGMHSADLLISAIETILDFSKIDSGQLSLIPKEFSVHELMDAIIGIARKEAGTKSLYLRLSIDDAVPDILLGDPVRVQQVIFNVVINAIKFTETGGAEIHVSCEDIDDDDKVLLVFEVRDTGIGISGDQMADLYKPLYTGDSSYRRIHEGMGMGLAISGSLTTLMGGIITCDSSPGEGSVFRIAIPFSIVPQEEDTQSLEAPAIQDADVLRGLRVLVAEDNNINQMIIYELLTRVGIETDVANNGIEALELLKKGTFDLVLMDIQMPEMDGLTATEQIRSDPRYDKLPIVAMTAYAGDEHVAESIKAGMNGHLTKPIDTRQLYSELAKWGRKQI